MSVNDVITGILSSRDDKDFFSVELVAGTVAQFTAVKRGYTPLLQLLHQDGKTRLASNEYFAETGQNRITLPVPVSGRYLLLVTWGHQTSGEYTIRYSTATPGPGDPPHIFVEGISGSMAAGSRGELFVLANPQSNDDPPMRLLRIDASGVITPVLVSNTLCPAGGLVLDGFGDLLITAYEGSCVFHNGVDPNGRVLRVRPNGEVSVFATGVRPQGITVGPDGDVWVGDEAPLNEYYRGAIRRYSPLRRQREFRIVGLSRGLTFSPDGHLYAVGLNGVYRFSAAGPVQVSGPQVNYIGGVAFDSNGFMYVTAWQGMKLYDALHKLVEPKYTHAPMLPSHVVFGRNPDGTMSSRLLVVDDEEYNRIYEANPSGNRPVGHRIGVDFIAFDKAELASGVIGQEYTETLRMNGVATPPTWSVVAGALPAGLTLGAEKGTITGTPTQHGTFGLTIRAEGGGRYALWPFRLVIQP